MSQERGSDTDERVDRLMRRVFRLSADTPLDDSSPVESLGATEWLIIELAIALEAEFGFEVPAAHALTLETVGDWRRLVRQRRYG